MSIKLLNKVAIVGGGNMGAFIVSGLISKGVFSSAEHFAFGERSAARREKLLDMFPGCTATAENAAAVADAGCVFLAVKPKDAKATVESMKKALQKEQILVSILAGTTLGAIQAMVPGFPVVRAMPNAAVSVNAVSCGYCCGKTVTFEQKKLVQLLLNSLGLAVELEEHHLKGVTAVSGSSPAFTFMLIEALADGGVMEGLPRDVSRKLSAQAVLGAAKMVARSQKHPAVFKDMITSPGGTTIAACRSLEKSGFRGAVMEAVYQCCRKVEELSGKK